MIFETIKAELRKGCGKDYGSKLVDKCGIVCGYHNDTPIVCLCSVCQAKLDQTLLCEKMHKDFVEKLKEKWCACEVLGQKCKLCNFIAELESEVTK
jgi:hypothetical protein